MANPHAGSRVHKLRAEEIYEQIAKASSRAGRTHPGDELSHLIQPASCFAIFEYKSIASASCCFSMYSPSVWAR